MTKVIAYRGPDGEGFYVKGNVGLAHRRLSIIDLETGNQPMYSDDEKKVLIFNGEIYNYIELREELKNLGYAFKTNSDTEVILKAYEQWGYDCQNKFNGMWAFALWDEIKEELFISRDRFGEKPLHYIKTEKEIVFASEIKSIKEYGIKLIPRYELLELYLAFTFVPAPHTFYKEIFKLMPGHYLIVKGDKVNQFMYWDLPQVSEEKMLKSKEAVDQKFEELLVDAVKIRMRSEVAFGAFLSGGLDSSSIVSIMHRLNHQKIKTFTIGFEDKAYDESKLANDVAKKFKTEHYLGTVKPESLNDAINFVAKHFDEPFGDSSAIPTFQVCKFAAHNVKMVLTGDGGDEALSGYNSYLGIKIASKLKKIPKSIRSLMVGILRFVSIFAKNKLRYKLNKIIKVIVTADVEFIERMILKGSYADLSLIKKFTSTIKNKISVESFLMELMKGCTFNDDFYKLMYLNYKFNLPNDYLVKVDRMSMANSIETRLPFLDYRLVEFMATVHKDIKMRGWEKKSVLRDSIGKTLPESLLNAPKRGFGIPLREWFKDEKSLEIVMTNLNEVQNISDSAALFDIVKNNKEGKEDLGNFIWTLLQLNKCLGNAGE